MFNSVSRKGNLAEKESSVNRIVCDQLHPLNGSFNLLPSCRHLSAVHKIWNFYYNSFVPSAIKIFNSHKQFLNIHCCEAGLLHCQVIFYFPPCPPLPLTSLLLSLSPSLTSPSLYITVITPYHLSLVETLPLFGTVLIQTFKHIFQL